MVKNLPLVRASNLLPFVSFLDKLGSPCDRLLQKFAIPQDHLFDLNAITTEYQMWSFLEQAARLEGIEDFGLLIAQSSEIKDMGLFGQLLLQSPTLKDCLNTYVNFIAMHHSEGRDRFWWQQNQGEVMFCARSPYRYKVPGDAIALDYTQLLMLKVLKAYLGEYWHPKRIDFHSSPTSSLINSELINNVEVVENQDYFAIIFPSYLLNATRLTQILDLPQQQISTWIASQPPETFVNSLQQMLPTLLRQQVFKVKDVAEMLGMAPRTFQRKLTQANSSFSQLLDQTRYEIAVQKLANPTLSVAEIGYELGYAHPPQFTLAFKRWTGKSPNQFRKQMNLKDDNQVINRRGDK